MTVHLENDFMNMTAKMCTAIASFTYFITKIPSASPDSPPAGLPMDPIGDQALRPPFRLALPRSPWT